MEIFGIIGMGLGSLGFIFGSAALSQVQTLKKELAGRATNGKTGDSSDGTEENQDG
jgi:hypothetical protein